MTVFDIISEPLRANYRLPKKEVEERVKDAAARVGLNPSYLKRYPMPFPAGSGSELALPVLWCFIPASLCVMNQSRLLMFPYRPRS